MEQFLKKYPYTENCPFRIVMEHFGNKWSMIILITLGENGKMRFNELNRCIVDISQKVLASTLRLLEKDGFVKRKMYPEIPPKVEYELTALGLDLLPLIERFADWAYAHIDEIKKAQARML
ncbi:winged helix-turn-helix transcriptional regulator [Massilibacteroides vaginae]|uniref:winged helix-turn-helix transcriptional regulator n=1 Tax=Massilibacteroides vaginae TaxID=1673718 RepID=UPI000A1C8F5A|nr:helix-turn-helix domain-containing protein [Massilibacteroides vaginae]